MFKNLILIAAITMSALSITGCGKSDDSASTTPPGGGPFTAAEEYAPQRTYTLRGNWNADIPTGTAMLNGVPLKIAGSFPVSLYGPQLSTARIVDARVRWTETTTRGTNAVTTVADAHYRDSLYCNVESIGTVALTLTPTTNGQLYRIIIDFPVTLANADGVTNIRLDSGFLSAKPEHKHYDSMQWGVILTKSGGVTYDTGYDYTTTNPVITNGAIVTNSATTSTLTLTVFRPSVSGSVKVINDADESVLSAFDNVTLVDTAETEYKTVTLTLPYAKNAGVTYRVIYTNIDDADSVQDL